MDSEGLKGILWDSWDSGGFWEFSGDSGGFWGFWLILGNGNLGDSGDYGGSMGILGEWGGARDVGMQGDS